MTLVKLPWKEVSVDRQQIRIYGGIKYMISNIKDIKRK